MNRREILQVGSIAPLAGAGALAQISTAPEWKPELFDAHDFIRELLEFADRHPDLPPDLQMRIHHWRAHKGF